MKSDGNPFRIQNTMAVVIKEKTVVAERKPEIVDSQGVVNTPKNVADIIVKTTLNPLFTNEKFTEWGNYRIVDICCGSGNFLLAAYEFIINRYVEYYMKNDCGVVLRNDNIVNRVACPTKLIDYLQYGLIPIVLSPHIGDFYNLGYKYIEYDEIINHSNSYSKSKLNDMAIANYRILTKLCSITKDNLAWLNYFVREGVDK